MDTYLIFIITSFKD